MNMENFLSRHGNIAEIYTEPIQLKDSFLNAAKRFSQKEGTVALISGGDLDCSEYHILATDPWLSLHTRKGTAQVTFSGRRERFEISPLQAIRTITRHFNVSSESFVSPVSAGLFGYLSYDLKDTIETLPKTTIDDLHLPDICLYAPTFILISDKATSDTVLVCIRMDWMDEDAFSQKIRSYKQELTNSLSRNDAPPPIEHGRLSSNFSQSEYVEAVHRIREYIEKGDVYQVNMSQRFETEFSGNPFSLFEKLFQNNPASFYAFIQADDHSVLSSSPERFIKQKDQTIETRPIKGTRPRSLDSEKDQILKDDLLSSPKDDAELSMIVDLLRNDIGKLCKAGSVAVMEHKRIEGYQNVYHLVSIIKGELSSGLDAADIIAATFPGGSITGCPKIRAMEIIDELETHRRHIYTGSIGYIGFHDTIDLSIAIRTATIHRNRLIFSVGGGIVHDSNPIEEYEETLHKGRTFLSLLKETTSDTPVGPWVWHDGKIINADKSFISTSDLGFQYGFGFFETLLAINGKIPLLNPHIQRFSQAFIDLLETNPPDLSWDEIIRLVLERNQLKETEAAVKITAAHTAKGYSCKNSYSIVVSARPYKKRLETATPADKKRGLWLGTYEHPRQLPTARYKTLNYLYYYLAGKWAKQNGYDEAIILNPDRTISEANTANILMIRAMTVLRPLSLYALNGVMQKIVCDILARLGYKIKEEKLKITDLLSADEVLVTNSLMGALPVSRINGIKLPPPSDLYRKINKMVFV